MAVANIETFKSYADALAFLDGKASVKIGHNTTLENGNDGSVGIRYHDTVIVRYRADGSVTFNTDGWGTMTTLGRMDQASVHFGYRISRKNWETVLTPRHTDAAPVKGWQIVTIHPEYGINVRR